jgi:hypothetical protein
MSPSRHTAQSNAALSSLVSSAALQEVSHVGTLIAVEGPRAVYQEVSVSGPGSAPFHFGFFPNFLLGYCACVLLCLPGQWVLWHCVRLFAILVHLSFLPSELCGQLV